MPYANAQNNLNHENKHGLEKIVALVLLGQLVFFRVVFSQPKESGAEKVWVHVKNVPFDQEFSLNFL